MISRQLVLASFVAIPAFAQSVVDSAEAPQSESSWSVTGSVGAEFGYHSVVTGKNETDSVFFSGNDSIYPGQKYRNYFQVPGIFGAWNAFVQMESASGQKIEFALDASSDKWNRFNPRFVQALYEDRHQKLVLGDQFVLGGDLYLASIDLFGASYDFKLNPDNSKNPLLVFSVFGGENQAPKLPGEKTRISTTSIPSLMKSKLKNVDWRKTPLECNEGF